MSDVSEIWNRPFVCDAGDHVIRAGQPNEHCFILLEGVLIRQRHFDKGRRQIVGLYVPGDVCGLTTLARAYADYDMVALSPVSYIPVTRSWLSVFTQDSADFSQALWREMSHEAEIAAAWIVNLGQRPAYQRLAYFLCELEARLRAVTPKKDAYIEWPGTQADIGAAIGLSLVHVNKMVRKLEADQLVHNGQRIRLNDVAKLGAIADFDPSYLALGRETLGDMLLSRIGLFNDIRRERAFALPSQHGLAQ